MSNNSTDFLADSGDWNSLNDEMGRNCTANCTAFFSDPGVQLLRQRLSVCLSGTLCDPGVRMLRHVVEVWLTTPIVLLGIAGNVVAFFILCQHRRHKLQTTTAILQVTKSCSPRHAVASPDMSPSRICLVYHVSLNTATILRFHLYCLA